MIERMTDLPNEVLGFVFKGKVTGEDYETVLMPTVEEALKTRDKVRVLCHLGEAFDGFEPKAVWDDAKMGLRHPTVWQKVAVVTDVEWMRVAAKGLGFLMPGHVRVFANDEMQAARTWVAE